MGMGFTALGAFVDPSAFRKLMDANRWWFALAQTHDVGNFYYQPNRDNTASVSESRLLASAVTALMFAIPERSLMITGKINPDYDDWAAGFPGTILVDPSKDPDGDNITNLEGWIWGRDPTNGGDASDAGSLFQVELLLDGFSYRRRPVAKSAKWFDVEVSTDLITWTCDEEAVETRMDSAPTGEATESERVLIRLSQKHREKGLVFARLRVR